MMNSVPIWYSLFVLVDLIFFRDAFVGSACWYGYDFSVKVFCCGSTRY